MYMLLTYEHLDDDGGQATLDGRTDPLTVAEPQICTDRPATITIGGLGFANHAMNPISVSLIPVNISGQATVDIPPATLFAVSNTQVITHRLRCAESRLIFVDTFLLRLGAQIKFNISANALLPGTYNVQVTNMGIEQNKMFFLQHGN
jgi:hypothetical protein